MRELDDDVGSPTLLYTLIAGAQQPGLASRGSHHIARPRNSPSML